MQIQTTHATTCWRTNQLHVASKLLHKHYTLESSTPSQHSSSHIHTHFTNIAIQTSQHNIRYSSPRNTSLRTCTTMCGPSTPQQASMRASHYAGKLPKIIDDCVDEVCIHCSSNTHSLTHIMTQRPALTHIRAQHNISSPLDLCHTLANFLLFRSGADLLDQTS